MHQKQFLIIGSLQALSLTIVVHILNYRSIYIYMYSISELATNCTVQLMRLILISCVRWDEACVGDRGRALGPHCLHLHAHMIVFIVVASHIICIAAIPLILGNIERQ